MLRKRDFFLYVLVFAFLLIGIFSTIIGDIRGNYSDTEDATFSEGRVIPDAVIQEKKLDREARLQYIKDKIAEGAGHIISAPPIMTSVDTPSISPETEEERVVQECLTMTASADLHAAWPRTGVTVTTTEGARIVSVREEVASSTASSSKTMIRSLIQVPALPIRSISSHCVDMDVVAFTPEGRLIQNTDRVAFSSYDSYMLVGYARDGFPIYGEGVDESLLDACGGYDAGFGYRYHLRENEDFILGCFSAPPAPFVDS